MPKKDLRNLWALLADLFRETSVIVRWCIVAGLVGGLGVGYLLLDGYDTGPYRLGLRAAWWLLFVALFVGGLVGCLAGVLLEYLIGRLRRPPDNKKRRRTL